MRGEKRNRGESKQTGLGEIGNDTNLSFDAKKTGILVSASRHCELNKVKNKRKERGVKKTKQFQKVYMYVYTNTSEEKTEGSEK